MIDELAQTYAHYVALRREPLAVGRAEHSPRRAGTKTKAARTRPISRLAFFPHYLVSGDERIVVRFRSLANDLKAWVRAECLHGYEPEAEAHHGTEPFLLFLPRYLGLFPDDREAAALLEDVAHHIGNWIEGVPAWYDWTRDVFLSYWIGTRTVGGAHGDRELAEHFRFLHIALAAWRVTGEARYRDWALRYGRKRAERLLAADGRMPVLWDLDGRGLQPEDLQTRAEWGMAANNHHIAGDPLAGIENLLASGAVYALGDLFLLEGDDIFRRAAKRYRRAANRRIARSLRRPGRRPRSPTIAGPSPIPRWTTRCARCWRDNPPSRKHRGRWSLPKSGSVASRGWANAANMIYWGHWAENGSVQPSREPSTAALALGYQLTGEWTMARRALGAAAAKFAMARRVLRGGREHADMGGAICSVAAGHGRNWGCGAGDGFAMGRC